MRIDVKALARRGALVRIAEVQQELADLRAAFPRLSAADGTRPAPGRRPMSVAQRKAVSERMRRFWAERRRHAKKR